LSAFLIAVRAVRETVSVSTDSPGESKLISRRFRLNLWRDGEPSWTINAVHAGLFRDFGLLTRALSCSNNKHPPSYASNSHHHANLPLAVSRPFMMAGTGIAK
jgi:hypothetical protein